jgi:hypothetical protein
LLERTHEVGAAAEAGRTTRIDIELFSIFKTVLADNALRLLDRARQLARAH